ncbi:hypothetical protein IWW36_000666 [Coemansia brasiliensis]|uniref:DUF3835 domain-containing protein n=1 Tax=Coemansia brasiliensis TaxID=2650707 RepID=A0A9W8II33_9FUNG|nr:hypothetical protein IWW36_000666 [Coemansia brasiliensis]
MSKVQQVAGGSALTTDTYLKYLDQNQIALQTALDQYTEYKAEYHELQQTLQDLPKEIEHEAMVPVGPLAFFPGKLIHTNEILVLLGDNWFIEQSAFQAVEIAQRREALVDSKIVELKKKLEELKKRKSLFVGEAESQQVGREFGGNIFNEEGEPIIDIKEELAESQLPDFGDDEDIIEQPLGSSQKATLEQEKELEQKRQRLIDSLTNHEKVDISQLDPETRAILERLDQIGSDTEEPSDSESSMAEQGSDEGDAFSDEDRANAARDDDEDDYNADGHLRPPYRQQSDSDEDVVVRETPIETSGPRSSESVAPKGILKPSRPPTSLFKSRRNAQKEEPPRERKKSVSFDSKTVSYTVSKQELLKPSEQEDLDRVTDLFGNIGSITDTNDSETSHVQKPVGSRTNNPLNPAVTKPRFKPNAQALSGVRRQASDTSDTKQPPASQKSTVPETQPDSQPLRTKVVEREPTSHIIQDIDEELHAREIAQKYHRMRQARMAAGMMDGAASIAEQVLSTVPGVTLVDAPGRAKSEDNEEYERIELPNDPSDSQVCMQVPEVIPAGAQNINSSDTPSIQQPAKPKMSRFKAQRLGLN